MPDYQTFCVRYRLLVSDTGILVLNSDHNRRVRWSWSLYQNMGLSVPYWDHGSSINIQLMHQLDALVKWLGFWARNEQWSGLQGQPWWMNWRATDALNPYHHILIDLSYLNTRISSGIQILVWTDWQSDMKTGLVWYPAPHCIFSNRKLLLKFQGPVSPVFHTVVFWVTSV